MTYTLSGFVNNDTQSVVTGVPVLSTTAMSTSSDGSYPITCTTGTLTAANYTFTCVNGSLTVSGATVQTIAFNAIPNQVHGAASIVLSPAASSGLPVMLKVSSGSAVLNGYTLTVTGIGTVTLTATQPGNAVYRAANPVSQSFTVTTATLSIVAANASRLYGSPNPVFTGTVAGALNGDTFSASFTTSATPSTNSGRYAIVSSATGLNHGNYTVSVTKRNADH